MTRQVTLLLVLLGILLAAAFWFLVYAPGQEEIAMVETQVEDVQAQQVTTQARIVELEAVRADAPTIEAALAAAQSLVPPNAALPATLRQLQVAADDAGVTIGTIAPSPPTAVSGEGIAPGLASVSLSLDVQGSYFQIVDFLRRLESPELVSRGIVIDAVAVSPGDYPELTAAVSARMFSNIDVPVDPAAEPAPDPAAPDAEAPDAEATEEDAA